jgi:hypothetical protein
MQQFTAAAGRRIGVIPDQGKQRRFHIMIKKTLFLSLLAAAALVAQANADTVNITDGAWHAFDVDPFSAQSGGSEWILSSPDNGSPVTFSFTLATASYLTVVDGGFAGDRFEVFDNGNSLGETSAATNTYPAPSVVTNFDAALADSRWSQGAFLLAAGTHNITGLLSVSALDDLGNALDATNGAVRVAPVPLPASGLLLLFGSGFMGLFSRRRMA